MSDVLSSQGGCITDEKYRNMTMGQWVFHHKMYIKKSEEDFKTNINLMTILSQDLDLLSVVINPKLSDQYFKLKKDFREKIHEEFFDKKPRINSENNVSNIQKKDNVSTVDEVDVNSDEEVQRVIDKYYTPAPDKIVIPSRVTDKKRFVGNKRFDRRKFDADLRKQKRFSVEDPDEDFESRIFLKKKDVSVKPSDVKEKRRRGISVEIPKVGDDNNGDG